MPAPRIPRPSATHRAAAFPATPPCRGRDPPPRRVGSNSTTPCLTSHGLLPPSPIHPPTHPPPSAAATPACLPTLPPLLLFPFPYPSRRHAVRLRVSLLLLVPIRRRHAVLLFLSRRRHNPELRTEGGLRLLFPAGGQPPHGPVAHACYVSAYRPAASCVRAVTKSRSFFPGRRGSSVCLAGKAIKLIIRLG